MLPYRIVLLLLRTACLLCAVCLMFSPFVTVLHPHPGSIPSRLPRLTYVW